MKKYIERSAVMQKFADYVKRSNNSDFAPTPTWNQAVQIVEDAPTADVVEVIHAHWVKPTKIGWRSVDVPHCSHCKEIPCGVDMHTHYCPNCGAKMDGGAEEE